MIGCVPPAARSGAASVSSLDNTWEPAVDPHGDKNSSRIKPDLMECKQLAEKAVGGPSQTQSAQAPVEALGGLLSLAKTARNIANVASYANALDATDYSLNAIGGNNGSTQANTNTANTDQYKNLVTQCMRKRGHDILG